MIATPLVRHGADEKLPRDRETGEPRHTLVPVYSEMLLQICRDYAGLPDARTLTMTQIRFFYEGLRPELKKHTGPKAPAPKVPKAPRPPRRR